MYFSILVNGILFAIFAIDAFSWWVTHVDQGAIMKINVKALLLWGIIFPFIISTIPMRSPADRKYTGTVLTNEFLTAEEIEQILEHLEVTINGTYGEFIHNNVINSVPTIDRGLQNNQFKILYYSRKSVDTQNALSAIALEEQRNITSIQLKIFEILIDNLKEKRLPDDFQIKTKAIIPNTANANEKVGAYELEIDASAKDLVALNQEVRSAGKGKSTDEYLERLKCDGYVKLSILNTEL